MGFVSRVFGLAFLEQLVAERAKQARHHIDIIDEQARNKRKNTERR